MKRATRPSENLPAGRAAAQARGTPPRKSASRSPGGASNPEPAAQAATPAPAAPTRTGVSPPRLAEARPGTPQLARAAHPSQPPLGWAESDAPLGRPVAGALGRPVDQLVGHTPLIRLDRIARDCRGITLLAKAEWFNPGGSVKDRPALRIIQEAEREGKLRPGGTILDATSGNTGIAYAWIGAARGYRVKLCMPGGVTAERQRILRTLGAELVLTDPMDGSDGAIREARRLAAQEPDRYYYADQYSNPANWLSHYEGTGPEIWEETRGQVTHFVATLGTSGTFMGTGRRLKALSPAMVLASVQPDSPFHGLEGLKHMASAIVPAIYDPRLADLSLEVGTEESYAMVKRLALEEGLLVGVSCGAAVVGALRVARDLRSGVVVTIMPDGALKYLSERFWEES